MYIKNNTLLPGLPKQIKKREADFGLQFRKWIEKNPRISAAYELKQCTTSLPFNAVEDHQVAALMTVKGRKGFIYKISDESRGQKPFDCFYLRNAPAYVVIKYTGFFCMIDIETFVMERDRSKRKSLTGGRAKEISVTWYKTK